MLKSSGRTRTGRDCALLVNFTLKDFVFHNSSADSPLAEPSETIISHLDIACYNFQTCFC